jgi:hypothetical protein
VTVCWKLPSSGFSQRLERLKPKSFPLRANTNDAYRAAQGAAVIALVSDGVAAEQGAGCALKVSRASE